MLFVAHKRLSRLLLRHSFADLRILAALKMPADRSAEGSRALFAVRGRQPWTIAVLYTAEQSMNNGVQVQRSVRNSASGWQALELYLMSATCRHVHHTLFALPAPFMQFDGSVHQRSSYVGNKLEESKRQ